MKTEMRRALARESFEEKIGKLGQLIQLSAAVKVTRFRGADETGIDAKASDAPEWLPPPTADRETAEAQAFRKQCRRQMARPLEARMKYGFCRVLRPVLDEPGVRSFASTAEYRHWCANHLPPYLGFQPAK